MLAMIVLDLTDDKLFIPYDGDEKLKLVKSDAAAEKYVKVNLPECILVGTFPDLSPLINIVLKERDSVKVRKKNSKRG